MALAVLGAAVHGAGEVPGGGPNCQHHRPPGAGTDHKPNVLSIAYTKDKNGLAKDSSIHSFFSWPSRVSPLNVSEQCGWRCGRMCFTSEQCGWRCCYQELGNYKSAHDLLYDTFRDLEADKKKVRTPTPKREPAFLLASIAAFCRCATMAIHFS